MATTTSKFMATQTILYELISRMHHNPTLTVPSIATPYLTIYLDLSTAASPSSGCIPSSWTYSTTLSYNSRTWVFYPSSSGYQVLAIYSYSSTSLYLPIDIDVGNTSLFTLYILTSR